MLARTSTSVFEVLEGKRSAKVVLVEMGPAEPETWPIPENWEAVGGGLGTFGGPDGEAALGGAIDELNGAYMVLKFPAFISYCALAVGIHVHHAAKAKRRRQ